MPQPATLTKPAPVVTLPYSLLPTPYSLKKQPS